MLIVCAYTSVNGRDPYMTMQVSGKRHKVLKLPPTTTGFQVSTPDTLLTILLIQMVTSQQPASGRHINQDSDRAS